MRILPRRRLAFWITALVVLVSVIALAFLPGLPIIHAAGPTPPPSATAYGDSHLAELDWTAPSDPSVVGYQVTWACG